MPVVNGIEALRRVCEIFGLQDKPVCHLTIDIPIDGVPKVQITLIPKVESIEAASALLRDSAELVDITNVGTPGYGREFIKK